jgi:flagellar FliJ protein
MNRVFPLQSLLDLSQLRLDAATRKLGELLSSQQEAAQRLEMLITYRQEYEERFLTASKSGLGREAWQNYRAFLDRLENAIEQARGLVTASETRTADGQKQWMETRGRLKAFDTLAVRHQSRVAYADSRQEQKGFDEHAARSYSQKEE